MIDIIKKYENMSTKELAQALSADLDKYSIGEQEIIRDIYKRRRATEEKIKSVSEKDNNKRYPALRAISGYYKLLAWGSVLLAIILFSLLSSLPGNMFLVSLIYIVISESIIFISLIAISEAIQVFIDIEENTRKAANRYI